MRKFLAKSPVVEAMQLVSPSFEGFNCDKRKAADWVDTCGGDSSGVAAAQPGDWVVRMNDGFAVMSESDFAALYTEKSDEDTPRLSVPKVVMVKSFYASKEFEASQFLPPQGSDVAYAAAFADWLRPDVRDVKMSPDGRELYVSVYGNQVNMRYSWWAVKTGESCMLLSPLAFARDYRVRSDKGCDETPD